MLLSTKNGVARAPAARSTAVSLAAPGQARRTARRARVVLASSDAAATATTTAPAAAPAATPTAAPAAAGAALLELNKDTFHEFLASAGPDQLVVVDFFTDWCGPCKLILPELVKLSGELAPAATIVKFNCNQANKELAKQLGIKVAPTFHLYKNGTKVADMTGAKVEKLRALISEHMQPAEESN